MIVAFSRFHLGKRQSMKAFHYSTYRTEANVVKMPACLDVQGLTVANHQPSLAGTQWFSKSVVEKLYFPEVQGICQNVTGAKMVLLNHVVFRRKLVQKQADPS
jgi:hypothetical protein